MKISVLSWRDIIHDNAGGSESVVEAICLELAARGHEVVGLHGAPILQVPEMKKYSLGGTYTQYVAAPFVWHRKVRQSDVIIDVQNGIPYFSPLWTHTPVVCLVHHVHTNQWEQAFSKPVAKVGSFLEAKVMPRVYRKEQYISISPSTTNSLKQLGIADAQIETVTMGTSPLPRLSEQSAEPLFVILGRLVPHKRVDLAIDVWINRIRPVTGGRLVVVGDGPELEPLKAKFGNDATFTGRLPDVDRNTILSQAWLLIHPASHEGWGTVVIEAGGLGVPTVGFDVVGVRDSVVNDVSGLLATDPEDFARKWLEVATDSVIREQLARGAEKVAKSHEWPAAIDKFESVLKRVAGK